MNCEIPQNNVSDEKIKKILKNSKTIAVIGLSPNEQKISYKVSAYMKSVGYKIVPIYPKGEYILDEKVYRSILDVPFDIDIVNVFRKPEAANAIYEDIKKMKNKPVLWLQLGIINNEVFKASEEDNIKMIQNKCIKIEHQKGF